MTTEVAKPEGEDIRPFRAGRAKSRAGGANRLLKMLGPGLVTGASGDDPTGIGTYSQVGAQFGDGLLWTMLISCPLMAAIQAISARIGRVTGCGIAANLRKSYPKPLLYAVLVAVSVANVFNLEETTSDRIAVLIMFSFLDCGCAADPVGPFVVGLPTDDLRFRFSDRQL